jgi:hypothetical protein
MVHLPQIRARAAAAGSSGLMGHRPEALLRVRTPRGLIAPSFTVTKGAHP